MASPSASIARDSLLAWQLALTRHQHPLIQYGQNQTAASSADTPSPPRVLSRAIDGTCRRRRHERSAGAAFLKPSILNLSRLHTCKRKAPELSISALAFASSATAIMSGEIKARPVLTRSPTDFGLFFTGQKKKRI